MHGTGCRNGYAQITARFVFSVYEQARGATDDEILARKRRQEEAEGFIG